MKKVLFILLLIPSFVLSQKMQMLAKKNDPGEVYVNNFDSLTGLTLDETTGSVSIEPVFGDHTPNVENALTLYADATGEVNAAFEIPLHNKIYVQYYMNVIYPSTDTGYQGNFEIGNAINNQAATKVFTNQEALTYRVFGNTQGFLDTGFRSSDGVWNLIGIEIDKVALTAKFYVNREELGELTIANQNLRYITLGGTYDTGYKIQFASITVNTDHFQDVITNNNGIGDYVTHFVDYSIKDHVDFNANWSGLHPYVIDVNNDGTMDDGPVPYVNDVGTNNKGKLNLARRKDKWSIKRGQKFKMENLTRPHSISFVGAGTSEGYLPTIETYGEGSMPILDNSIIADDTAWVVYDAPNGIYRQPIANVDNATGAWEEDTGYPLRQVFDINWLANDSGAWFEDGTYFYVRLWDDSDPSLKEISIGSNQTPSFPDYTQIRWVHFRHGNILVTDNMIAEQSEFSYSSGASVTNGVFRDNYLHDLWGGTDYGTTSTNSPAGEGYGSSGDGGGTGLNAGALVYRNIFKDPYLGVSIGTDADGAVFAYNLIVNTHVNSISFFGDVDGDVNNKSLVGNNTVLGGGRHTPTVGPLALSRPQPNHIVVHQNGAYAKSMVVNNLFCLHYNENTGFTVQDNNSTANIMSFVTNSLAGAVFRMGYNTFYRTDISTSPSVIFNGGAGDNVASWGSFMYSSGDFRDIDNTSNPDSTSNVVTSLPITSATYTAISGKWLAPFDFTPVTSGNGYNINYAQYGIYKDLAGNTITDVKNRGAF